MPSAPLPPLSDALPSPPPASGDSPAGFQRFLSPDNLVRFGILTLAAFLRLFWLDERPPHFDEGVNGWFTDQMQHTGFYKYDPSNYHGPLHFYVLFLFKCLLGRNLWALRLPVALVGILTVDWTFRFRVFFGQWACAWAALAMALSPGMTFFQRDAIHETWLVFFLVLAFWGLCGLWQEGGRRHLWGLALGVTGAVLTKETYLVHFACFFAALPVLWILEDYFPCARRPLLGYLPASPTPEEDARALWNPEGDSPRYWQRFLASCAPQHYRAVDVWVAVGVCLGLTVFFYSGNFFNWNGLNGLVSTFAFWGKKAHEGEGHNKPFIYWTTLVLRNEPFAALGLLACLRWIVPPLSTTRFRVVGISLLVACLLGVAFWFTPGKAFGHARRTLDIGEIQIFGQPAALVPTLLFVLVIVLLVAAVSLLSLPPPTDWRMRLLAIYAPGTLLAYSLIPYKTPWCAISFLWPFFFAAGVAGVELATGWTLSATRSLVPALGSAVAALSAWWMADLNFVRPTDEKLAYVYVQTFNDMWRITEPLLDLARDDPSQYHLRGVILCGSTYPLPWVLGDFTGIGYYGDHTAPGDYRADFLLVEDRRVLEAERHLDDEYFKETLHLRPAQNALMLYLRAPLFSHYFPDREPEFRPLPEHLPPTETLSPETTTAPSE